MTLYVAYNQAAATTAALTGVTTGTSLKTMLQIATPSTRDIRVVKWGVTTLTAPTAPVVCELIQTDVAATVTAHVAAGVQPYDNAGGPASLMTLGTTATGYTATDEGTVTATRQGDYVVLAIGVSTYAWEWSLGREWHVPVSKFLRVRMTTSAAVSAVTWVAWQE